MYCSLDVKLVYRVVVNHFGDCIERFAKLSQNVFVVLTHNLQVHEGVVISEETKKKSTLVIKQRHLRGTPVG